MGRKPGGKKSLKVTKFDKAIAIEIMHGNTSASEIEKKLSVASSAFNTRLEELIQNGFFIRENESLKLGLKGFEKFYKPEKPKPAPLKPAEEKKAIEQNKLAEQCVQREGFAAPANEKHLLGKTQYSREEKEIQAQQQLNTPSITTTTRVDLHDLLQKGAPTRAQEEKTNSTRAAEARQSIPTPQNQKELTELLQAKQQPTAAQKELKELVVGGEAVCELCRTPFKLGASGNPKYGHCFCGAAYHKDCYEAALDATGECARCGRKLELRMDKKSVEAVKELKELF